MAGSSLGGYAVHLEGQPLGERIRGKLRDALLSRELFLSLAEVRYVLDERPANYSHRRPHSRIGCRPACRQKHWRSREDRRRVERP